MYKIKKIIENNKYLGWVLILTNWLYQGIAQSDKTEKIYKISFSLIFWLIFFLILNSSFQLPTFIDIGLGFILAHSLNWILNCNHFVIYIHRIKWIKTSKKKLFWQLISIQGRLESKSWMQVALSLGGISRGTMNEHSDIDVNIIRKPGLVNGIKAVLFAAIERKRADINGIPLDIMISDTFDDCIKKTKGQKNPVILCDPYSLMNNYYSEKMNVVEAKRLNNVSDDQ